MPDRREIALIGVPMEAGAGTRGACMGPDALRTAGLAETLADLGHGVTDHGNLRPGPAGAPLVAGRAARAGEVQAWIAAIDAAGAAATAAGRLPVYLGGDHSLSAASINVAARAAAAAGRPLHVLWLDAHSDFNTPATSPSGNLHGMPVAALTGLPGLDFLYDGIARAILPPAVFHMIGIRSVDADERRLLRARGVHVIDMRQIDEHGVRRLMAGLLAQIAAEDAVLHVSLDADFLDPDIAPGVGTAVPGGATWREAHLAMEMLAEQGRVGSLDLVEVNPYLDDRGRTARIVVELTASLFGRTILDAADSAAGPEGAPATGAADLTLTGEPA